MQLEVTVVGLLVDFSPLEREGCPQVLQKKSRKLGTARKVVGVKCDAGRGLLLRQWGGSCLGVFLGKPGNVKILNLDPQNFSKIIERQ
jgi:hypothetical protein